MVMRRSQSLPRGLPQTLVKSSNSNLDATWFACFVCLPFKGFDTSRVHGLTKEVWDGLVRCCPPNKQESPSDDAQNRA